MTLREIGAVLLDEAPGLRVETWGTRSFFSLTS